MHISFHRELPVIASVDVLVVGGGSAGATAAIAAARCGASVALVERYGFLGGTGTQVLDTFYGFFTPGQQPRKVVGGIPDLVVAALEERGAALYRPNTYGAGTGITYHPEVLKQVWEQLAAAAGVQLLYHTFCTDVLMNGSALGGVVVDGKAGLAAIRAGAVVDASGDADVAARAGAPYESDFTTAQAMSASFRVANVDTDRARSVPRAEFLDQLRTAAESGRYHLPRLDGSVHMTPVRGVMHALMTRVAGQDPAVPQQLTRAEIEGRRQAFEYFRFLRDLIPGYEQAELVSLSTQIGIRETRRIYGEYRLTRDDVMQARRFPDAIAQCGAPIEDHRARDATHWEFLGQSYDVPFRCLLPQQVENLLVAGRCLSADHNAHASVRNGAQCMAMGQAAGTAAALAVRHGTAPRRVDVDLLRSELQATGAILE